MQDILFLCRHCGESLRSTVAARHRSNMKRFGSCVKPEVISLLEGDEEIDDEMIEIVNCRRRRNPISVHEGITLEDIKDWT